MRSFRPMLQRHNVTEQQWRVLRVLEEQSPLDATEVAEKASILAPSLTRIIRALADRDLLSRAKVESDGRRVLLSISPSGIALINDLAPERRALYREIEQRFGRENVEDLLDKLEALIDRLS
jgi:homoprotocatechuate degradation regulator HpaR